MPLDYGPAGGRGRGWARNSSLVVTGAIEMLAIGDAWSEILEVSRRPKWCWPHVVVVPSLCRMTPQSRDHHRTAETDSAVPAMPPYQRRCRMRFGLRGTAMTLTPGQLRLGLGAMRLNRCHGTQVDPSGSRGPFDRPDNPEQRHRVQKEACQVLASRDDLSRFPAPSPSLHVTSQAS